ncbi:F-box/FBD/LRR protein, partial [Trifolium medium]|nr:F-box/FBD/LRR protein [Trifolium medium]
MLNFSWDYGYDDLKFQGDCAQMWVRAAAGPHLQELSLSVPYGEIYLAPSLFINCNNLVFL